MNDFPSGKNGPLIAFCIDMNSIAAHVVVLLSQAQALGRTVRLDELASDIGVRKADVRGVVSALHAEGHVDAIRLRLTLSGLALATSLAASEVQEPRRVALARTRSAA